MDNRTIPEVRPGDAITAELFNAVAAALARLDGTVYAAPLYRSGRTIGVDLPPATAIFKTKSGGIPALVGDEPGVAECDIYRFNPGSGQLEDTLVDADVYNMAGAIDHDAGKFYQAKVIDGVLFVDVVPCG
jgi:hypothetical protein